MAEHGIDELFELPLEEFTAARNRLAASLDTAEAAEVRALAKPTVPAWTVNQLARRHPGAMRRLLDSGAALQKAQERALKERGPAKDIREAQEGVRKAIAELTRQARSVLEDAGRSATRPMLDRIAATLEAGAQTVEGRDALEAGRLTDELEPAGFAALSGITPAPSERGGSVHDELAARRKAREERERRRRELREEAQELESRARAAEREADRAEAAAAKARTAAVKARQRADEAAEALAGLD